MAINFCEMIERTPPKQITPIITKVYDHVLENPSVSFPDLCCMSSAIFFFFLKKNHPPNLPVELSSKL
jgi:hypothetical protein